jgi:CBS domain containing-hemolysin-like protein
MACRAIAASLAALLAAAPAHASFLHGETLAKAANVIALVVIFLVPIVVIVVFWMVHVLPEKIAHKRHHPQRDAIQVLCLLSLVFGGMLWPIAWLWAYSKPVLHKMAYGTDKHEDYFAELAAEHADEAQDLRNDVARLRADLEKILSQGGAPEELSDIRDQLAALEPRLASRAEEAS